jgi:hypothetical protein
MYRSQLKMLTMETLEKLKTKADSYNPGKKEGAVAKAIEENTARLPSDLFLWTAVGCMTTSLALKLMGKNHLSLFVGQWVSPFLLFGIYNKIVKVNGHDSQDSQFTPR